MRRIWAGIALALTVALLSLAGFALTGLAEPNYPALTGRVVDETGTLSAATRARLSAQLEAHERATSNQVVVAVVKSLQGTDIADYGVGLGRAWRIGTKENNGVLLIVAPNDRQVRIEVGYGQEGRITDALASTIIREEILPAFRRGNLEEGIDRGMTAILRALEGTGAPLASPEWTTQDTIHLIFFFLVLAVIVGQFWRNMRRASRGVRGPWDRRYDSGWSGWSFGGGRSSGSSGPSWSGGGGSFGGGGASGRW